MSRKLVECVPNISEGRDRKVIDRIVEAAAEVDGVDVVDVDAGFETHRTVITLVGSRGHIEEAAFRIIAKSAELIDMSKHQGAHARHGATDVCPFIPVAGVTMEDCVEIARGLGRRVGDELGLPVYMYDQAALREDRRSLAVVRAGEYEAVARKMGDAAWAPDFGPAEFLPHFGVVTVGAREFLIAYNVNLNTRSKQQASDLAFAIREKGRAVRRDQTTGFYSSGKLVKYRPSEDHFPCGDCPAVHDSFEALEKHISDAHHKDLRAELAFFGQDPGLLEKQNVMMRGRFRECRAVGWMIPEYGRAQISINLTHFRVTSTHEVLEECRRLGAERGLVVTGSEIVGVVPYEAMQATGEFYLRTQGQSRGIPVGDVMETAIQSLGLRDLGEFDAARSILGLPTIDGELASMSVKDLADEVSRATPAPGGGSIAALAGSLAAALAAMVANLSHGKKSLAAVRDRMEEVAVRCQKLKDDLLRSIDADTDAFNDVIAALRLPRKTEEEQARRAAAVEAGYKIATQVPLRTAELCLEALRDVKIAVADGLESSVTDAGVGGALAHAALVGAIYNVKVNLGSIADRAWVDDIRSQLSALSQEADSLANEIRGIVEQRIA